MERPKVKSIYNFQNPTNNTFDIYSVSFGVRNFSNTKMAMKEAHRVLKRGGRFICLEFSKVENEMLDKSLDILELNKSEVQHCDIHSWRLAYKKNDFIHDVIWDQNKGLGVCGDWFNGPKVENAWLSAQDLAKKIK